MFGEEKSTTRQHNRSGFLRDRFLEFKGKPVENILESPLFDENSLRSNSRFRWN